MHFGVNEAGLWANRQRSTSSLVASVQKWLPKQLTPIFSLTTSEDALRGRSICLSKPLIPNTIDEFRTSMPSLANPIGY
jgi:hypothetical protein